MHGLLAHDASYTQTLELSGSFEAIVKMLSMVCDPAAVPASARRYTSGVRACEINLYYCEAYPVGLIGPVTIIWNAVANEASLPKTAHRQVMIRFHPGMLQPLSGAFEAALSICRRAFAANEQAGKGKELQQDPSEDSVQIAMHFRTLCAFELTGPMATDALKACLRIVRDERSAVKKVSDGSPSARDTDLSKMV